jgi:uracil-xanthine permease
MDLNALWGKNTDATTKVMPEQTMGFGRSLWQAAQHLLTASGANIVAPMLMHIDPSMALFTSGVGTLVYNKLVGVPAYMGTSFSYIAPIALVMTSSWGNQSMVGGGIIVAGLVSILVGLLIRLIGYRWIDILMPPVVLAMVVIAIGMLLAPTAYSEAMSNPLLALLTFGLGVVFATKFRQGTFISALPVLLSIVIGYVVAIVLGQVDFSKVNEAPFFAWPRLFLPVFDMRICVPMALITFTAVLMEHLGHLKGTGSIVGRDYIPRASRSLIADGISNALSWAGTPSVTYGENMGVFAITQVFSLRVMYLAGVLAMAAGFLGKLSPIINAIPASVLGGATFLLFGMIAWSGFNLFQTEKIDMAKKSNQVMVASMSTMMIAGIVIEFLRSNLGNITPADLAAAPASVAGTIKGLQGFVNTLSIGSFQIPALVAVAFMGIFLNLILNWGTIVREVRVPSIEIAEGEEQAQPAA